MVLPLVQFLAGKRRERAVGLAFHDRGVRLVELMLAHDDPATSRHGDVSWGLRKSRDNFVIGRGLGRSMTRQRKQKYQRVEGFLHGRFPKVEGNSSLDSMPSRTVRLMPFIHAGITQPNIGRSQLTSTCSRIWNDGSWRNYAMSIAGLSIQLRHQTGREGGSSQWAKVSDTPVAADLPRFNAYGSGW